MVSESDGRDEREALEISDLLTPVLELCAARGYMGRPVVAAFSMALARAVAGTYLNDKFVSCGGDAEHDLDDLVEELAMGFGGVISQWVQDHKSIVGKE